MKNKLILIFTGIILFGFLFQIAFAQEIKQETVPMVSQIQSLEGQVILLDQINGKILNTIYWALGGLISVFILIIGLNFFQNYSLNKRKLDEIKKEMENDLKKEVYKIKEQNKKDLNIIDLKIKSIIKSEASTLLSKLEEEIKKIKRDYSEIKRENLIRSAFEHKGRGENGYILKIILVIEIAIKKDWNWLINESLDLIEECLNDGYKNSDSLMDLQKALDKLTPLFSRKKESIESKMNLLK